MRATIPLLLKLAIAKRKKTKYKDIVCDELERTFRVRSEEKVRRTGKHVFLSFCLHLYLLAILSPDSIPGPSAFHPSFSDAQK